MEQKTSFLQVLDKINRGISQMKEALDAVHLFYRNGDIGMAYERALKLEERAEKTTLFTRALPAYTGNPCAAEAVDRVIKESIPVQIGFTSEGWFTVQFPALLPKKNAGSADYIRQFLYPAMNRFFQGKPPVRYKDCVLVIRHVYDRRRPERAMRDHDNIEINMVTDIVAMYVLPDDHPAVCSHYYCSTAGSEDRTEVYVVPKHDFPLWLIDEKTIPDKGVRLYENIIL